MPSHGLLPAAPGPLNTELSCPVMAFLPTLLCTASPVAGQLRRREPRRGSAAMSADTPAELARLYHKLQTNQGRMIELVGSRWEGSRAHPRHRGGIPYAGSGTPSFMLASCNATIRIWLARITATAATLSTMMRLARAAGANPTLQMLEAASSVIIPIGAPKPAHFSGTAQCRDEHGHSLQEHLEHR